MQESKKEVPSHSQLHMRHCFQHSSGYLPLSPEREGKRVPESPCMRHSKQRNSFRGDFPDIENDNCYRPQAIARVQTSSERCSPSTLSSVSYDLPFSSKTVAPTS